MEIKICNICNIEQNICNFYIINNKYIDLCKICKKEINKKQYIKNKDKRLKKQKEYANNHKEEKIIYDINYRENKKDIIKQKKAKYYQDNKQDILEKRSAYAKENKNIINNNLKNKYNNDINYKLRKNISNEIRNMLYNNNCSKNKISCLKYLEFTIEMLKIHIESLFEPWMNWNNHGKYNKKTYDIKPTWNLDHIIPQSKLPYHSMNDENFKICWSLNNLRPFSSKQNILDNCRRDKY